MSDIVDWLRLLAFRHTTAWGKNSGERYGEAAAEITRLRARVAELTEVLKDLHAHCVAADEYMRAAEFMLAKPTGEKVEG